MRILVVEDDRLLNNTLCYNLDAAGYIVDSALTKSEASNFLIKQNHDLIVLDVNLQLYRCAAVHNALQSL